VYSHGTSYLYVLLSDHHDGLLHTDFREAERGVCHIDGFGNGDYDYDYDYDDDYDYG
jgi:hypothetical protein